MNPLLHSRRRGLFRLVVVFLVLASYTTLPIPGTTGPAQASPDNDAVGDAIALVGAQGEGGGSNVGATSEPAELAPGCDWGASNSVWWSWTAPTAGRVTFATFGSDFNTVLSVHTGVVHPLAEVGCSDSFGGSDQSVVSFTAVAGIRYWIRVAGKGGVGGLVVLSFGPSVVYVDAHATGANDGSSWSNAFTSLQTALATSVAGQEVWVAKGTYQPTPGSDRSISFGLVDGVALYGGFAGSEINRSERDWSAYPTILTGDLAGDDTAIVDPDEPSRAENTYNVVVGSGVGPATVLDGFTITGGNANGTDIATTESGGGVRNFWSEPTLTNLTVAGNSAAAFGGGMFNFGGSPRVTDVLLTGNSAANGGGIYNLVASPWLANVTVTGNTAGFCGGAYNSQSAPVIQNSILWGNAGPGPEVFNYLSPTTLFAHSLVGGAMPGGVWDDLFGINFGGNLDADPLFSDTFGRLGAGSPAINAGANSLVPAGVVRDLDANPRILVGHVDMGAFEWPASPLEDSELLQIGGADHMAVLLVDRSSGATFVAVSNVATGSPVSFVVFGSSYVGSDLEIMADTGDAGSSPELVVLGTNGSGFVRANAKDSLTGNSVGIGNFGNVYSGTDLEVVGADMVVLGTSAVNQNVRVQTRSLANAVVGTGFLGTAWSGDDLEVNGTNVGVLGSKLSNGNVRVRTINPVSGAVVNTAYWGNAFTGLDVEARGARWAVLQEKVASGAVRVQTRSQAGVKFATASFGISTYAPSDLEIVAGDVAVLGTRTANQAVRVQTRTASGGLVGTANFGTAYSGIDLEAVGPNAGVLGDKASNGKIRNQIRTTTGAVAATVYYN